MPPRPLAYEIDEQLGLVLVSMGRQPSLEDWLATLDALVQDPKWVDGFSVVIDRRSIPPPEGDYVRNAIRAMADRFSGRAPMRWATVAPPGPVAFGMSRMAELVGESAGVAFRAFQSLDEAMAWATTRR